MMTAGREFCAARVANQFNLAKAEERIHKVEQGHEALVTRINADRVRNQVAREKVATEKQKELKDKLANSQKIVKGHAKTIAETQGRNAALSRENEEITERRAKEQDSSKNQDKNTQKHEKQITELRASLPEAEKKNQSLEKQVDETKKEEGRSRKESEKKRNELRKKRELYKARKDDQADGDPECQKKCIEAEKKAGSWDSGKG